MLPSSEDFVEIKECKIVEGSTDNQNLQAKFAKKQEIQKPKNIDQKINTNLNNKNCTTSYPFQPNNSYFCYPCYSQVLAVPNLCSPMILPQNAYNNGNQVIMQ